MQGEEPDTELAEFSQRQTVLFTCLFFYFDFSSIFQNGKLVLIALSVCRWDTSEMNWNREKRLVNAANVAERRKKAERGKLMDR